jgi:hypothetical protein
MPGTTRAERQAGLDGLRQIAETRSSRTVEIARNVLARAITLAQADLKSRRQLPQRHHRGQPHLGVAACRRVHEPPAFLQVHTHAVEIP